MGLFDRDQHLVALPERQRPLLDLAARAGVDRPEGVDRHALDVAGPADRDDHILLGDQVLDVEGALIRLDLRASRIAVLLLDPQDLFLDHAADLLRVLQ